MKIIEDRCNIYIEDCAIPKGQEKADIKARENVVWAMLGKWLSQKRNYESTMAVFELDFILANATKSGADKPKSKRQEKFMEMLIMNVNTPVFLPYFGKVKMLVGITKQKKDAKKIQYSITAIEPVE